MLDESNIRLEIDQFLQNKGWVLTGRDKNVFVEKRNSSGVADYVLYSQTNPLMVIEAKKRGADLNKALEQAVKYAKSLEVPIACASDGNIVKTVHMSNSKPLLLNNDDGLTKNKKRERKEGENDLDIFLSYRGENDGTLISHGFDSIEMNVLKNNDFASIPRLYKLHQFNTETDMIPLQFLLEESKDRNTDNVEVVSVTNNEGLIPPERRFKERVASPDTSKYRVVYPGYFTYNPARLDVGSIARNRLGRVVCVSPMYPVFKVVKNELHPPYLELLFKSKYFRQQVKDLARGTVRNSVKFDVFCKIKIPLPTIERQKRICAETDKVMDEVVEYENKIERMSDMVTQMVDELWE